MDIYDFSEDFKKYFGEVAGGPNLKASLENLPLSDLQHLHDSLSEMDSEGRIFFLGNGGSFDNARLMAAMARNSGFKAKTPSFEEDYHRIIQEKGYAELFCEGLKEEGLNSKDLVIGISGSGNSANVLKALSYSVAVGVKTFAVGGRDGGVMKSVVEKGNCILASSECMEIIEDTNNFMMLAVFKSIKEEVSLTSSVLNMLKQFQEFLNGNNFQNLALTAARIQQASVNNGRVFVLGTGIGANHFRADLMRGATNQLPVKGIQAPEVFTSNSFMATANDEGRDFTLASGLSNFSPSQNDFALLFETGVADKKAGFCKEILEKNEVPYISVSEVGLDISCFDEDCQSFAVTMIGHSCSVSLNTYFKSKFKIREVEQSAGCPEDQKKLGMKETIQLEERFRAAGLITANEVLTFSYGKVYAVSSSEPFERKFF